MPVAPADPAMWTQPYPPDVFMRQQQQDEQNQQNQPALPGQPVPQATTSFVDTPTVLHRGIEAIHPRV
jgi:hypothetical protein